MKSRLKKIEWPKSCFVYGIHTYKYARVLCLYQSQFPNLLIHTHTHHFYSFHISTIFRMCGRVRTCCEKVYNDQRYYLVFRAVVKWVTINVFLAFCSIVAVVVLLSTRAAFMVHALFFFSKKPFVHSFNHHHSYV